MTYNVLITGSSGGFGQFLSTCFESYGHHVIKHEGSSDIDLSRIENLQLLVNRALEFKVNLLVNNAAIICPAIPFSDYSEQHIIDMINVNLTAPILLIHRLLDHLDGIININSMVGLEPKYLRTMYSASKWGLRGFSNSLKLEYTEKQILDVYPTNMCTWPNRPNSQDANDCATRIYNAFISGDSELILDGRPKSD